MSDNARQTPPATQPSATLGEVIEKSLDRAWHKLGHVSTEGLSGDNLAVTLCTHYDDGEGEEDENGWTEAATSGCDAMLKAIHAVYVDALRAATLHTPPLVATATVVDAGEVDRLVETAREVISRMSGTYTARNGRPVGIQDDDGEKCWIVHSDQIAALQGALLPFAAEFSPAEGEQ